MRSVLEDIGAAQTRSVTVLNKCDLLGADELRDALAAHPGAVAISARTGWGMRGLLYRIAREAAEGSVTMSVLVPYDKGLLMKMVHERCQVMRESYVQGGLMATVKADERMARTLAPYRVLSEGELECGAEGEKDGLVGDVDDERVPADEVERGDAQPARPGGVSALGPE